MQTAGFVGSIEVETRNAARLWFSLTVRPNNADWIKIGSVRAWFTMNLESSDRPSHFAQLSLLTEAMRSDLPVQVDHAGAATFHHHDPQDSFEVDGIRVLRASMRF